MTMRWYVVHTYSGFEKQVSRSLKEHIRNAGMEDKFGEILVPTEEVVEMKSGQKRTSERKFFPGYVLVKMEMDDETWHLVKDVPKVSGFIGGSGTRPTPISDKEADAILRQVQEGVEKRRPVPGFQRHGRGRQLREEQAQGIGVHLRTPDAGGAGILAGGEGLNRKPCIVNSDLKETGWLGFTSHGLRFTNH